METSFGSDDDRERGDHASAAASSDNEQDDIMEDADPEENEGSDDDKSDDNDNDDEEDEQNEQNDTDAEVDAEADGDNGDSQQQPQDSRSRSTTQPPPAGPIRPLPTLIPGATTASTYDMVPYVAAPQSTSINAFCATPCMRWMFTGGSDGYIRRFDWFQSINGRVALTVAQKHPFVDSVIRAGVLLSYWENEEPPVISSLLHVPETTDDLKISPVYSLAVQNQSLWLLSGLESGGINLQSVRHEEGKIIHTLRRHTSAVSVLTLFPSETSVLSGSWDRNVYEWDLNTGDVAREYLSSAGQVSTIAFRPYSTNWEEIKKDSLVNGVSVGAGGENKGLTNGVNGNGVNGIAGGDKEKDASGSPAESTRSFGSLFGDDDDDMGMGGEEDEMSRAIVNGLNGGPPVEEPQNDGGGDTDVSMEGSNVNGTIETQQTARDGLHSPVTIPATIPPTASNTNGTQSTTSTNNIPSSSTSSPSSMSDPNIFLVSSMDGIFRIWDRRAPNPVATSYPSKGVPPWCMSACWSNDGNFVYVGRRNGTVEEYSVHKGANEVVRTLKFPLGSGPVSALRSMPNGRHLLCASFDNIRLYDLKDHLNKHSTVPFLIIPGHHGGVVSTLYIDATCRYLISAAGNRGWEGSSTEVLLGYEIGMVP